MKLKLKKYVSYEQEYKVAYLKNKVTKEQHMSLC